MSRYTDVTEMHEDQAAWDELYRQAVEDKTPPREPIVLAEPEPHEFLDRDGYASKWCRKCKRQIHGAPPACPGPRKPELKIIQGDKA